MAWNAEALLGRPIDSTHFRRNSIRHSRGVHEESPGKSSGNRAETSWGKVPEIQVCEGGIPELFKGMRV